MTATREPWADRVSFDLQAAARIGDTVRGSVSDEGRYYLSVRLTSDEPGLQTPDAIGLDDALRIMSELSKSSSEEAFRRARRMGLGRTE